MLATLLLAGSLLQPAVKVSDLVGNWQGSLEIFQPGGARPMEVLMKLNIAPLQGAEGFSYQIIYPGQPPRNYKLLPVDAEKGHWQIDEQNGIKLDTFWNGYGFSSSFTVAGNILVTNERRIGEKLVWEFLSFDSKTMTSTGGTDSSPAVTTQRLLVSQRAEMSRTAAKKESSRGL